MTPAEAVRILAVAAMFDRRIIGEADALAWADALDGLDPRECAQAVRDHFRESADYLMPHHVRARVALNRRIAMQRKHTDAVVRAIESAKSLTDPERSHRGYLAARAAFDEALRAKKQAAGEPGEAS